MPAEPDKLDTIIGLLLDIKGKIGVIPPPQPIDDETAKFLAKWAPVDAAEFQKKYGIAPAPGNKIEPMHAYDETEAIYRARACYATNGFPTSRITTREVAINALKVISHADAKTARELYECGYGLAYPDTCMYGFYTGLFATQEEYAKSLGAAVQPRDYAGVSLAALLAPNFGAGTPSGG